MEFDQHYADVQLSWTHSHKAAAHITVRPSVLITVKLDNNKYFRLKEENPSLLE